MRDLLGLIIAIQITDVVDIALVTGVFFALFRLLRESRSRVALEGLLTVLLLSFFIYFIARFLHLNAMSMLFERFWIVVVLAALIVFQTDFRRALVDLGQLRILRALFQHSAAYLDEIANAAQLLSSRRIGALIVIERRNPLRPYSETGSALDSIVTSELLRTIFTPHSPLHDGAAVIRNERIAAASCILPLTSDPDLSSELGTRHRAALGLSEETDAVVIVISEETGIISVARDGTLTRNLTAEELRRFLGEALDVERPEGAAEESGS